jgi:hypothetical protein
MRLNRLILFSILIAGPAAAQNSIAPAPSTPPPAKAEPAPSPGAPPAIPPTVTPAPVETAPAQNVVVVRETAPLPEPVTIDADAAYPNGFADPADPFGNDMSLARRDQGGFNWGLLGLLGLLGLIPLFRRGANTTRTVYVDRDDPRRILREEETR